MALGTSTTLSVDFPDRLTMRLAEEPSSEFPLATMANLARAGAMGIPAAIQRAGQAANMAQAMGQGMGSLRMLDSKLRSLASELFFTVFEPTEAGKTFVVPRPGLSTGTVTEVSRRLTEGVDITSTPISPSLSSVSLTCREYAGPYDNGQAAVAPLGISSFAANRSTHDMFAYIGNYLAHDHHRWIESVFTALLMTTTHDEYAGLVDGSAATDMTSIVSNGFGEREIRRGVRFMRERGIRPFSATGRYLCLVSPRLEEQLLLDATYREASRYATMTMNPLWAGYSASFGGVDVVVSNYLPAGVGGGTSQLVTHPALFVGANNPLAYGIGLPVEARMDPVSNFNRNLKFAWFQHAAYALLEARAVQIIHAAVDM